MNHVSKSNRNNRGHIASRKPMRNGNIYRTAAGRRRSRVHWEDHITGRRKVIRDHHG